MAKSHQQIMPGFRIILTQEHLDFDLNSCCEFLEILVDHFFFDEPFLPLVRSTQSGTFTHDAPPYEQSYLINLEITLFLWGFGISEAS